MIVSQIALPGIGPHSESLHMVLLHNLESVPLSFGIEFCFNITEHPVTPPHGPMLDQLKGALTVYAIDASPKALWKRQDDLLWTAVRRTVGARRSGRVMLMHKRVKIMSGKTPVCGTVAVTLPVVAAGTVASRQRAAQLDHPAHVLVTVFDHVGFSFVSGGHGDVPAELSQLMPPVGGSCEFLVPPDQPA